MKFTELRLSEPTLRAVRAAGYTQATPIQARTIPPALDGRDVLGCAQTGTGKTAAFALPILERLAARRGPRRAIRALVITPTRELAAQVGDSLRTYGAHLPLRSTVIFGGVNQHRQVQALRKGVEILVATPGRLLDLMQQGHVRLDRVECLVLDEADRMLDMGFINDIRTVVARIPAERQTLFFSATMPKEIRGLASSMLVDPAQVSVAPQATAAETVAQRVLLVERTDKQRLLGHLLADPAMTKTLVFTRTKHGADRVAKRLGRVDVRAEAIHGGKSQNARNRALRGFASGKTRVLVASDLAARGLDIDDISHVVNFDLPNEPETYVHRIGRTGRAGASGVAISFCASEERGYLRLIERTVKAEVPVDDDHPFRPGFDKKPAHEPTKSKARSGRTPARAGATPRRRRNPDLARDGKPRSDAPPRRRRARKARPDDRAEGGDRGRKRPPRRRRKPGAATSTPDRERRASRRRRRS